MIRTAAGWLALALLLLPASRVGAVTPPEVLLSSFGPGDSYDGTAGYVIVHYPPGPGNPTDYHQSQAVRFTPTGSDFLLHSTRLSLFRRNSFDPAPTITIAAADAGGGPGATLASKVVPGFIPVDTPFLTETAPPISVDWIANNLSLQAGQNYWMYLHYPASTAGESYWSPSSPNALGAAAARGHSYGDPNVWNVFNPASLPAFSVLATRVPEPAAAMLAGLAALVVGTVRRRAI
jgi:hypothetical protein